MEQENYTNFNVWAKLLLARVEFLQMNVKKSGVNRHLEFQYFELEDIVPVATLLGAKYGLLFAVNFTNEAATMEVINTDNPEEKIVFTSPMREIASIENKSGGKLTNAIQNLGSVETYQRRYLYMTALDITEHDTFDGEVGEPEGGEESPAKKTAKKSKKPVSTEERKEIKEELVAADEPANELQIEALKGIMEKLLELDPEREPLIQEIVVTTDKLTNLSKAACEELIKELGDLVNAYEVVSKPNGVED